jgi:hypothetical protein
MRRKLHWLLISRLVMAAALLAIVGLTEKRKYTLVPLFRFLLRSPPLLLFCRPFILLGCETRLPLKLKGTFSLTGYLHCYMVGLSHRGRRISISRALSGNHFCGLCNIGANRSIARWSARGNPLRSCRSARDEQCSAARERLSPYEGAQLSWIQFMFSLNLVAIFAVAILSSQLAERIRRSEIQLASATRDLADYRLFNDRIIESMRSGLVTTRFAWSHHYF